MSFKKMCFLTQATNIHLLLHIYKILRLSIVFFDGADKAIAIKYKL